jgi:hypothetical protein
VRLFIFYHVLYVTFGQGIQAFFSCSYIRTYITENVTVNSFKNAISTKYLLDIYWINGLDMDIIYLSGCISIENAVVVAS